MYREVVLILIIAVAYATAFRYSSSVRINSKTAIFMGTAPKPSGFANTKEGKVAILERTKALIGKSSIILNIPIEGVTKEQTDILRKEIPEGTVASVVKNALMRKAVEGTEFEPIATNLRDENMFLFVPEGESKKAYDAYKKWQKEIKRTDAQFDVKGGATEGQLFAGSTLEAVVSLPTKKELITKIAQGIKAVPLKVARGVKAVPNKVGRAFAAIRNKLEDESKPAEAPVETPAETA